MAKRPTKVEIAEMKVLFDLGETPKAIARKLGRSHHTVKRYLLMDYENDPELEALVKITKDKQIEMLTEIWTKATNKLSKLLEVETKTIPVIAAMDRSFQQLRLLQNESTDNLSVRSVVAQLETDADRIRAEIDALMKAKEGD